MAIHTSRCALQLAIARNRAQRAVTAMNLEEPNVWNGAVGEVLETVGASLKLLRIDVAKLSEFSALVGGSHVPFASPAPLTIICRHQGVQHLIQAWSQMAR